MSMQYCLVYFCHLPGLAPIAISSSCDRLSLYFNPVAAVVFQTPIVERDEAQTANIGFSAMLADGIFISFINSTQLQFQLADF